MLRQERQNRYVEKIIMGRKQSLSSRGCGRVTLYKYAGLSNSKVYWTLHANCQLKTKWGNLGEAFNYLGSCGGEKKKIYDGEKNVNYFASEPVSRHMKSESS